MTRTATMLGTRQDVMTTRAGTPQMTEYFPDEKEDEDATFIVSSFKILLEIQDVEGGGRH